MILISARFIHRNPTKIFWGCIYFVGFVDDNKVIKHSSNISKLNYDRNAIRILLRY